MSIPELQPAAAIDRVLVRAGFIRKSKVWRRDAVEVVQIVEMQKSQYGQQHYVNVGLWLNSLAPSAKVLKERDCHVRFRLGSVLPSLRGNSLDDLLNLETHFGEREREELLTDMFEGYGLQLLDSCLSIQGIQNNMREGQALVDALATLAARKML